MQTFLWRLAGILLGIIAGVLLAALTGDLIARAFGVSNFEGGRGYFVAFIVIPLFAIVGAILGAIMITQGWRLNSSVLGVLLLMAGGFAFTYRQIVFNLPIQTEKMGNFEMQTYASESWGDHYSLRYLGKRFDVEEHAGKEGRNRRVNTVVLITPTVAISTTPLFLFIIGPSHDTRSFYLVGEKDGLAFAKYLCDTNVDAIDALDNLPVMDLTGRLELGLRTIYLHRKEITGSRWLLLGDACVFDLQSATPYPFTSLQARYSADLMVDRDQLPVALSPDMRSLVRIAMRNEYDTQSGDHLGHSLHLLVNNFVEDTDYTIAIDRQRMRYSRFPTSSFWVDDIDQRWLDHHFEWQKGADGSDHLVERSRFLPWAHLGWVSGYDNDLEYRLRSVKPEMLDKLEEFLVARFGAKRVNREHSVEDNAIDTSLQLQLEDKELTITFRSDEYSAPHISFWQSAPDPRDGEWLKMIALAVNQQLQSGVYDELFIVEPFF